MEQKKLRKFIITLGQDRLYLELGSLGPAGLGLFDVLECKKKLTLCCFKFI